MFSTRFLARRSSPSCRSPHTSFCICCIPGPLHYQSLLVLHRHHHQHFSLSLSTRVSSSIVLSSLSLLSHAVPLRRASLTIFLPLASHQCHYIHTGPFPPPCFPFPPVPLCPYLPPCTISFLSSSSLRLPTRDDDRYHLPPLALSLSSPLKLFRKEVYERRAEPSTTRRASRFKPHQFRIDIYPLHNLSHPSVAPCHPLHLASSALLLVQTKPGGCGPPRFALSLSLPLSPSLSPSVYPPTPVPSSGTQSN
ncbi:hypothetical protein L227DRAFT_389371 [Lentinus tigrinus ALCF2SS1-6]|uniref:Uncharacterized protein n=1 Tax=Lentinus tigrinus ALCF2SS1-6 TaxID=1328759 RepID=A0A5C2SJT2_9APHY|nr:hypothetical protein L227DRAFT_389371 [Lentinus tigrinus ALCF2SS1-6]